MIAEPRDATHFGGRKPENASGETRTRRFRNLCFFPSRRPRLRRPNGSYGPLTANRLSWEGRFFVDSGMGLFGYSSSHTFPNNGFPKREVGDSAPPKIDEVTLVRPFHGNL